MPANSWLKPLQLGWSITLWLTLGVGGGLWVDKHFQTSPLALVLGTLLAFAACAWSLIRLVKTLDREDASKNRL